MVTFIVFCLDEKREKSVINQKLEVPKTLVLLIFDLTHFCSWVQSTEAIMRKNKAFSLKYIRLGINFFLKRKLSLFSNKKK
jgi:hypothetical protein